jgi:hypothetical protein
MEQQERIAAMAAIMVAARQAGEDVGELIAASLHTQTAEEMVSGRPGSWEADIILRMAQGGGYGNRKRIEALSILFADMGKTGVDGGDELSQAMGQAVDTLGGLDAFAGTSQWYHDLINIGCQYSKYPIDSASVYRKPSLTWQDQIGEETRQFDPSNEGW